eukprot:XP_014017963.1 PREDICTED: uncharacterized protein LOC106580928 isoform X2 [Salmo salar]
MVPLPSLSFKPLSSPESPIIIQNLRIPGTIMAKEHRGTGSHPYTLYTVKGFNGLLVAGLEAFIKEQELAVMQRLRGKAVQASEEMWEAVGAHRIIYQVHPFKILLA